MKPASVPPGETTTTPLEHFTGTIVPTKTGPLYNIGLGIVAFAMVLLPLIYIGLILFASWGVVYHLKNHIGLLTEGSNAGLGRLLAYAGPAVVGILLVVFMVKPFFAARPKRNEPLTLDPAKEPLLFAFVKKICGLVGASEPCRIDVDCQVNASASLRRGLLSNDLVLTIGLPLASGLDMRQFGGVLAHEFGHFAQGAGMRMTYIIRSINFWFARVVYERDAWDVRLERAAKDIDFRIGIMLHAARGCIWLTRRILWALMQLGHGISCFMLRQMEYDADSYEAKLAGSDAFASTASRLRLLNVATQFAYEDVRQSWTSNRLPENLPLLIDHKAGALPPDVQQKLASAQAKEKTRWFDTHPCDVDRIRAVEQLKEPGVFRMTEPATRLFSDFAALSKTVTRYHYEKDHELKFTDQNLMPAEEILRESAASAEADAMVRKYYGEVNISLKPLVTGELPRTFNDAAMEEWTDARKASESLREEAATIANGCGEQLNRMANFLSAYHLGKAGFTMDPKAFDLPAKAETAGDQEIAAKCRFDEATAALADGLAKLDPFASALSRRVMLALRFAQANSATTEAASEIVELARLLAAVGPQMQRAHQLGVRLRAFTLLAENRGNHSNPATVDQALQQLGRELNEIMAETQQRLQPFAYPFRHAQGQVSVAEYLRSTEKGENEVHRLYLASTVHLDRIFALNYRLIGKVLAYADAAEGRLGTNTSPSQTGKPAAELQKG